jgi:adenine-specific DNA-methyltransferase
VESFTGSTPVPLFLFPEAEAEFVAGLAAAPQHLGVECTQVAEPPTLPTTVDRAKALGAYYTDSQIADFLVWWALRQPTDMVMDPSFGGGVFLRSAGKRIRDLRGTPSAQVFGVELADNVHAEISVLLQREFGVSRQNLVLSDFFEVLPSRMPQVDAVVGNPPFIRYQRFKGDTRQRALSRAAEEGLKLSALTSSWLPFLIHSIRFLRTGGRLAMVIPFEVSHAGYAQPVLHHLAQRFESVTFLTFRRKLFPDLSEDTLLLLADGRRDGAAVARFQIRDLAHAGGLYGIQALDRRPLTGLRRLNTERIASGEERLIESLISRKARTLYQELRTARDTTWLGYLADVGIGYVTGANDFFHLSSETAEEWTIPGRYLRACVRRSRGLTGLRLTRQDWSGLLASGEAGYLLELPATGPLPDGVNRYLEHGKRGGVHKTFKCSNRSPWYRVPHVYEPDAFLTYMSGGVPRLVANDAGVVGPNSLHILRLHDGARITSSILAALWQTSLTRLSVEIQGHALGGGMLKLEPSEAEQVLLPFAAASDRLENLASELDRIARECGPEASSERADQVLLREEIGLAASDVRLLREAAGTLRERRTSRSVVDERD